MSAKAKGDVVQISALACPFCGKLRSDMLETLASAKTKDLKHWVFCCECGASGPLADTKYEAVEKWNLASRK